MRYRQKLAILSIAILIFLCIWKMGMHFGQKRDHIGKAIVGKPPLSSDLTEKIEEVKSDILNYIDNANYIDDELYAAVKEIYDEIDFSGEFHPGDYAKYGLYREQFKKMMDGEVKVKFKIPGTGKEEYGYLYELEELRREMEGEPQEYYEKECTYYFFDMDGDNNPELFITNNRRFTYVFKYEEESGQIAVWHEETASPHIFFYGTLKLGRGGVLARHGGMDALIRLDSNGEPVFSVEFIDAYSRTPKSWEENEYFVALPDYMEPSDWMKSQAVYDGTFEEYFFQVTQEQFDELTGEYYRMKESAKERRQDVAYTYAELFGAQTQTLMELAEKCCEEGEYEEALQYYASALELDNTLVEVYRKASDAYLAQDKCVEAVQILMDGIEATGAQELSEREAYLRENIVVTESILEVFGYDAGKHGKDFDPSNLYRRTKAEYDENGNMIKFAQYLSDGSVCYWNEYDKNGNLTNHIDNWDKSSYHQDKYGYEYDINGKMKKCVQYYNDGSVWIECKYDTRGNRTECIEYCYGKSSVWERQEYEYDTNNNRTKEVCYDGSGSVIWRYEWKYDADGNLTEHIKYDGDGSIEDWDKYEYGINGNMTKHINYNDNGSICYWNEDEYDISGNLIKEVCHEADGSVFHWQEWEYGINQNLVKYVEYDGDKSAAFWREEEYDADGNLTKHTAYSGGSLGISMEFEYDAKGNKTKYVSYSGDGSIKEGEWEYDALGNMRRGNSCMGSDRQQKDALGNVLNGTALMYSSKFCAMPWPGPGDIIVTATYRYHYIGE